MSVLSDPIVDPRGDRRSHYLFYLLTMIMIASILTTVILLCSILSPVASLSVTVFGGTGFAGSRVCKLLVGEGASVTSISKSGSVPKWCADEEWAKKVEWKSADLLSSQDAALDSAVGNPDAVVSCVGVVGTYYVCTDIIFITGSTGGS